MSRLRNGLVAALAALAAAPASAHAVWDDAQLVSVDNGRLEQGDGPTTAVDISGDGRWVVFQSRATNFFPDGDADAPGRMRSGGVFRFDRTSGRIELVADGDEVDELTSELLRRGATTPSVSDDGRFVSFATAQSLTPADDNDNIDVYVRDMTVGLGADRAATGAYALVSARDGGDQPARYAPRDPPLPGRTPGSAVFVGQSISGDGRYVAFRTTEQASDLPDRAEIDTSPGNVFVRDLLAKRTVLVSRGLDGTAVGGALTPVVLSRDGSTVSWVGQNAPLQTRMIDGETLDNGQRYYLWRRWDDPGAGTRRITGLADPDDPACGPGGRVSNSSVDVGPCDGPLTDIDAGYGDISSRAPALSADGWTVAFLSGAGARPAQDVDVYVDAFTTSMRPGQTRKAATRAITKGTTSSNALANGDIESVALSGDGSRMLLVTGRRQFLAPAPTLLGEQRVSAGGAELYAVDLAGGGSMRRVLLPGGADLDGAVDANAALSGDGRTIAFVSGAANLVRGDANDVADAFAIADVERPDATAPPVGLGEDPIDVAVNSTSDDFDVSASARRDGTLLVRVVVPGEGTVRAVATTRPGAAARARSRGRGRGGASGRGRGRGKGRGGARAGARSRARRSAAVKAQRRRQVATARATARSAGGVRLTLRPGRADRRALRRGTPLPVRVTVTFAPRPSGATRRATVNATFRAAVRTAGRRRSR